MEERQSYIMDCCLCGDPVQYIYIKNRGVETHFSYNTLVADWIVHSHCFDKEMDDYLKGKPINDLC